MQDSDNGSPLSGFFKRKWVRVIIVIDIIAVIAIIAVAIINSFRNSVLVLNIAPLDANVTINGKNEYKNGQYSLSPGEYEVTISHESLDSKTISVELKPHNVTTVSLYLSKDGNFDFYEQKENYESYQKLYSIISPDYNRATDSDSSAESFISDFQKNYSIFTDLPIIDKTPSAYGLSLGSRYQNDTLTIRDGRPLEECTKTLCLQITDTSGTKKEYAESIIDKFGYDHNKFQLIYQKVEYEQEN